ncbi:NB-ARC domains-containing protein [Tanacetum coccineum]
MGGIGKTTLAKIVYNDKQVNDHFTCKAWVCVSEEWDSVKISNIIFQSVTGETKEFRDLNLLQIALIDQLRGKQFLLVLDDVWTDKIGDWETLVLPFSVCARGKRDEVGWKEMVDSKIWSLKEGGGILPALKLSYHELPASLKKLFAYCSLFPKDYLFDKDDLVLLWMEEGFLHQSDPSESETVERIGLNCFDDLLSRSFFQHSPNDESLYVMHDLMNDLATSVARDYKNFEGIKGPKGLRTFLSLGVKERWLSHYLLNKVLVDILPQLQFLRVLSLSGYEISELPDSIGKLKHLRYLNLSRTKITHFPENVCDLYNLETLILFGCSCLTKFPKNFRKLKSLRHLDITDTPLLENLPLGIGELKSVQTLTKIIIGGENKFSIIQPKGFEKVQGKISFKGFDKVLNATKAQEAFLSEKMFTELEVEWCDVSDATRNDTTESDVLAALEPDKKCLKRLGIVNYLGLEFPKWVGDPSFHKLARVSIRGCKKCTSLPPLGQLRSLKELSIQDMGDIKVVGSEFLGTGLVFPRLEVLSFEGMQGWEVWSTNGTSTAVFPRLKELRITNCPNLVNVSLETLPLLKHLEISSCGGGVLRSLVHAGPSVTKLIIVSISGLTNAVWRGVILDLKAVEELIVKKCD